MKRFLAPLALTLGLVLVVVVAASFRSGPADHSPQTQVALRPAGPTLAGAEQSAPLAQTPVGSRAAAVQAEAQPAAEPAAKTGCGKAVPCPNRDCKDCPLNRYLK